jgi:hypothetical protein
MVLPAINALSLEGLFQLRLVIARLGEMDNAGWWNTKRLLDTTGTFVMKRGFSHIYPFVQAQASFAVAASQCQVMIALWDGTTLWQLPAAIENQFDDQWQTWLDEADRWPPFFTKIFTLQSQDVLGTLHELDLITNDDVSVIRKLKHGVGGYSLMLLSTTLDDMTTRLLATGFAHGAPGKPVVPYMRVSSSSPS